MQKPLPNWEIWRYMPTLKPEQAIALSLGVNPEKISQWDKTAKSWVYLSDRGSAVSVPGFSERLLLYRACHKEPLSSAQLAQWARAVNWNVPLELATLDPSFCLPEWMPAPDADVEASLASLVAPPFNTHGLRHEIERLGARFVMDRGAATLRIPDGTVQGTLEPLTHLSSALTVLWRENQHSSRLGEMILVPINSGGGPSWEPTTATEPAPARAPAPAPLADVNVLSLDEAEADLASAPESTPVTTAIHAKEHPWIALAKTIAIERYLTASKRGWGSDQASIAREVEDECEKKGIRTVKGKKLTVATIKRHALTPWDIPQLASLNGT